MHAVQCPSNAFRYNGTECSCNPGYLYNWSSNNCTLFEEHRPVIELSSGVNYDSSLAFRETLISFNSITKLTQSQAVFLEATLVMLLLWLGFCLILRLLPIGSDGRSPWFKIRWWISRLDISFATRHWINDQKPVIKRKTELGGSFSVASWILFTGLFAALLYQIISKRRVEVHNIRAMNAPDLTSFLNDLELNITTISSMSCAHLRGLGTLVTGNPTLIDSRVVPLSTFANYSCLNTTVGPTIALHCNSCRLIRDLAYISWQFVDLPNNPATAVSFQFNLSAKNPAKSQHLSYVSGTLRNDNNLDREPITYRGKLPNIIKFNLLPRIYHNLNDLKLIQPLLHEFIPGSYYEDANQLRASIENTESGLVNTTLSLNFLSSYIIEIDNQDVFGPVSFLADLGGLYCISIGIFFYLLVQCEYRIKRLRNEDYMIKKIRNRRKALDRWDKLRKYVMYTWGSSLLDNNRSQTDCAGVMRKSLHQHVSSHEPRYLRKMDAVSYSKKKAEPEHVHTPGNRSHLTATVLDLEKGSASSDGKPENVPSEIIECKNEELPMNDTANVLPLPLLGNDIGSQRKQPLCIITRVRPCTSDPSDPNIGNILEFSDGTEISMVDLKENLKKLYEYNVKLRQILIERTSAASFFNLSE